MAAPFGQPLPEHQRIVAQPLKIIGVRHILMADDRGVERTAIGRACRMAHVARLDHGQRRHQMCFTTSGMS